jgi:phosphoribosylglycinamide formyltransferase 1
VILGILASGEGTTLQALLDACARQDLVAQVGVVISNNSGSGALRRAADARVACAHLSSKTHPEPSGLDGAIRSCLEDRGVELVVLAGFLKKLGPLTLSAYGGRILNTHPALLPKFGGPGMFGRHVHRAVLAGGDAVSGASVHMVTAEYDAGPVLAQRSVPVHRDDTADTLAERVQTVERALLVDFIAEVARGERRLPALGGGEFPRRVPA